MTALAAITGEDGEGLATHAETFKYILPQLINIWLYLSYTIPRHKRFVSRNFDLEEPGSQQEYREVVGSYLEKVCKLLKKAESEGTPGRLIAANAGAQLHGSDDTIHEIMQQALARPDKVPNNDVVSAISTVTRQSMGIYTAEDLQIEKVIPNLKDAPLAWH